MKKFILFSLVLMLSSLLIFTVGCQEESTISGPEQVSVADVNQLNKKDKSAEKKYSASKLITVEDGGKIKLKISPKGEFLGKKTKKKVKISAEIEFAPGTVLKDETFTMTWDPIEELISFYPQMDFMKVAPLTISVKGVDLKKMEIKKDNVKFVYFDAAGDEVEIVSKKIWFGKDSFGIYQASIDHYSRFGFKIEIDGYSRYGFTR